MRARWVVLVAGALAFAGVSSSFATVRCVRPAGGAPCVATISAALAAASNGDTIRVATGVYTEDVVITKNIVLEGGWSTTFSVRNPQTLVTTIEPATLDTSVVSIEGSFVDPAQSTPTLDGFTIRGGRADMGSNHGGGLRIRNSNAVVRNNIISDNKAYLLGGGVWVQNGAPLLEGNSILYNTVDDGGGLGLGGGIDLEGTQAVLRGNTISHNTTSGSGEGWGGGIFVSGGGPVLLVDNTIMGNQAHVPTSVQADWGRGSGIGSGGATLTVRGGTLSENLYAELGGGMYASGGDIVVEGVRIIQNGARDGGALAMDGAIYDVRSSIVALNETVLDRAALRMLGSSSGRIVNCTLVGLGSGVAGVGINADVTSGLSLTNTVVQGFEIGVVGAVASGASNDFFDVLTDGATSGLLDTHHLDPFLDGSFHLGVGSPVVDLGKFLLFVWDFDVDGEPRRMKGPSGLFRIDVGADERVGAGQRLLLPGLQPADLTVIGPGYPPANPDSGSSNDGIGFAVLGDDVDGDGAADLVVSAQDWAEDFTTLNATGRLFGLSNFGYRRTGVVDLLTETADLVVVGQRENQHMGQELASGDLDGDGAADLVIGSGVQTDGDPTIVSTVIMLAGGPALAGEVSVGPSPLGDFSLLAQDGPGSALGDQNALAVGDLDGDGRPDLVAGDHLADDGATPNAGGVFVVFGKSGLSGVHDLATTPADFTLRGPAADALLGKVSLGDLDGDGKLDLVARSADAVYGLFGPLTAGEHRLASAPADLVVSGLTGDGEADRVALIDVTGDGQADLLATSTDTLANNVLLVFAGPFTEGQSLTAGDAERTFFVAFPTLAAADVEGDPRPELVVGSQQFKTVWVVPPGSPASSDLYSVASTIILGEGPAFNRLGWDIAAGDLDGNERDDLIVSTWQVNDPTIADPDKQDVGKVLVFYSPDPWLFADGFESGDVSAWFGSVP